MVSFIVHGGVDDSSGVIEETKSVDGTVNRTSLVNFVHHGFSLFDLSVFLNGVDEVTGRGETAFRGHAVLAENFGTAFDTIGPASGLVVGAGLVSDRVVVNILIAGDTVTTIAAEIGSFAGNEDLGSDLDIGPGGVSGDLDTIGEGGG
jgi:hypothetical protein